MINRNIFNIPFLGKKNNELNSSLFAISLAIGASIGYYLIKKYTTKSALNSSVELSDLRKKAQDCTANLLGNPKDRNYLAKINVPEAGTLNWKKERRSSMFPAVPDPNIRIN